jgi:sugar lactone lactonase YvrE
VGPFAAAKLTRLAVNASDEIAGLDRDQKAVVLYDTAGKTTGRIPLKGTGYDLQNPEDLTYDAFGHLYVLDRGAIAVFTPYAATPAAAGPTPAPAAARSYRLLTLFTEPQTVPTAFRRASAFALDPSGAVYLYDDRAERVLVYR